MSPSPPPADPAVDGPTKTSLGDRFRGLIHMRPPEDDEPQSWWIASTAIPLVAAAAGPLANVMSIVALVMPWRSKVISKTRGPAGNLVQEGYADPHWVLALNSVSLVCGVVGNVFLLFNFTQLVRYIIALPVTIIAWFLATGILSGLTAALSIYSPPAAPDQIFSQAYWSAVIAAILYFILGSLLMINMLGYFLGRYPQHFSLTDDQRTLILQMTAFVAWLLVGAAIFQRVLDISFADALYFCDITVLTLGFGDVTAQDPVGRGLIWPYAVIGIIMLGLVVRSIHQFAREVHYDNVIRKHIEQKRQSTFDRSVSSDRDIDVPRFSQERDIAPPALTRQGSEIDYQPPNKRRPIRSTISALASAGRPKLLVMREEKDRFEAMRAIQYETMRFRRWNDLLISLVVFGIVWSCGAIVFWQLESMTYFEGLYFCFCSLLTIGYGDFTPQSNAGRPFFVMWSLIAIPTMTMLISQMSDTVVSAFESGTEKFADYFVLPQAGKYRAFLAHFPCIFRFMQKREEKGRLQRGFEVSADAEDAEDAVGAEHSPSSHNADRMNQSPCDIHAAQDYPRRTLEELAREENPSPFDLAQQLAFTIRRTTLDARQDKRKRYSYEEWVEFTRLIQFTDPRSRPSLSGEGSSSRECARIALDEDEYGVLNWDWIGENSPMLAHQTEPEWVLDRLCESLVRYVSTQEQARAAAQDRGEDVAEEATLRKEKDLGIQET